MTRILALYLPQYYETDYNNAWWGQGYTEWVACKKAKPLFAGQYQPRLPKDAYYYNLTDIEALKWQADVMNAYGIDGACIYHYYSSGSLLLEKPIEMLYNNPDVGMHYCFNWANHDWRKNWFGQDRQVIWPQTYGDIDEIHAHYNYCRKYFNDSRYIKHNNKPVFFIYNPSGCGYLDTMMREWDKHAIQDGYDGMHFIVSAESAKNAAKRISEGKSVYFGQPAYSMYKPGIRGKLRTLFNRTVGNVLKPVVLNRQDYEHAWARILSDTMYGDMCSPGAFPDWDNSPRRGYNSTVFTDVSVDIFEKNFRELYKRSVRNKSPFIVINAWNEWAEGAYLEPDTQRGYQFLEAVKRTKESID